MRPPLTQDRSLVYWPDVSPRGPSIRSPRTLHFSLFEGVSHAVSTRHGGISSPPYQSLNLGLSTADSEENVLANRRAFLATLNVPLKELSVGRLVHGDTIAVITGDTPRTDFFLGDAVISDVPDLHFLITYADCVPLAVLDRRKGVVGAAHAGWRGTALGIGPKVVERMVEVFGSRPADILVGIGPSIGPCCYRVGAEVGETFHQNGLEPVMVGESLDLWTTNERQLLGAGLPAANIENLRLCTSCHVADFFSHRAEAGVTGRGALCIGIG